MRPGEVRPAYAVRIGTGLSGSLALAVTTWRELRTVQVLVQAQGGAPFMFALGPDVAREFARAIMAGADAATDGEPEPSGLVLG